MTTSNNMKKTLFLISILLFTSSYSQINKDLKAFYSFKGNSNDQSGQGNNGQIIGSVNLVEDRFGIADSAYQFPGNSSNYISINYSQDFNIGVNESFSICLWYKGGSKNSGDFEVLFGKENPQLTYKKYDYFLGLYDGNRVLAGGSGLEVLWSPIAPPENDPDWHFVVFIYDNKNWYLYQDNILTKNNTNKTSVISQSLNGLVIGKGFQGIIDDVRFYNRKLSASEIDILYKLSSLSSVENSINKNSIFPNPTNKNIHISRKTNDEIKVFIYDTSGKLVFNNSYIEKEVIIDISKFPKGNYILKTISLNSINSSLITKY